MLHVVASVHSMTQFSCKGAADYVYTTVEKERSVMHFPGQGTCTHVWLAFPQGKVVNNSQLMEIILINSHSILLALVASYI